MGLDRGVRLSRLEWAAVRGALGRPRRLSQAFLRQERVRLEAHRAAVRAKYEEVTSRLSWPRAVLVLSRFRRFLTARSGTCSAALHAWLPHVKMAADTVS